MMMNLVKNVEMKKENKNAQILKIAKVMTVQILKIAKVMTAQILKIAKVMTVKKMKNVMLKK